MDGWFGSNRLPTTTRRSWRHRISSHHFFKILFFFYSLLLLIFFFPHLVIFFVCLCPSPYISPGRALLLLFHSLEKKSIRERRERNKKKICNMSLFPPLPSLVLLFFFFKPEYIGEYIRERKAGADERIRTMGRIESRL